MSKSCAVNSATMSRKPPIAHLPPGELSPPLPDEREEAPPSEAVCEEPIAAEGMPAVVPPLDTSIQVDFVAEDHNEKMHLKGQEWYQQRARTEAAVLHGFALDLLRPGHMKDYAGNSHARLSDSIRSFSSAYFQFASWDKLKLEEQEKLACWALKARELMATSRGRSFLFRAWIWDILDKGCFLGKVRG
jgi:hypothetical protein